MTAAKEVETLSAAELYAQTIANRRADDQPKELVTVTLPSGFPLVMQKPPLISLAFKQQTPVYLTSKGAKAWGRGGEANAALTPEPTAEENAAEFFKTRDAILALSHSPKLVVGAVNGKNELSVDDLDDADCEYLFYWFLAGGDEAALLVSFRRERVADAGNGSNGKKRRKTGK